MPGSYQIATIEGDGIGPEIMKATLDILLAAGAQIEIEEIEVHSTVLGTVYIHGLDKALKKLHQNVVRAKVQEKFKVNARHG